MHQHQLYQLCKHQLKYAIHQQVVGNDMGCYKLLTVSIVLARNIVTVDNNNMTSVDLYSTENPIGDPLMDHTEKAALDFEEDTMIFG
ncbi:hypothetical protein ACOSP7_005617 [Xanthoceras sorbifolium]